MKSGKQRRAEIKARRLQRALRSNIDCFTPVRVLPVGTVAADPQQLRHNNTYGQLPLFYVDRAFSCRDCNRAEVWTAKQQKWWYEIAKGSVYSHAVRCRVCRRIEQQRVETARRAAQEGLERKLALERQEESG